MQAPHDKPSAGGLAVIAALLLCLPAIGCRSGPAESGTPEVEATEAVGATSEQDADGLAPALRSLWWVDALEPGDPGSSDLVSGLLAGIPAAGDIEVVVKPAYGPSGIQAFLASTARVAPERLPDLAVLPLGALRGAREAGLLQTLPEPEARAENSFAFAAERAGSGQQSWAIPFAVDLLHAIGREIPPPQTWAELTSLQGANLVLPLGGSSPPELAPLLSTYAGAGGDLARLPEIDEPDLRSAMERLAGGLAGGWILLPTNGNSPRAAWNRFAASEPSLAAVNAGSVVANQAGYPGMTWGPLPGEEAAAPSLAWGWALVVVTPSPERQSAAAVLAGQLADALSDGSVLAAGWLPARLQGWRASLSDRLDSPPSEAYLEFLETRLSTATLVDGEAAWRADWARAGADLAAGLSAAEATARLLGP